MNEHICVCIAAWKIMMSQHTVVILGLGMQGKAALHDLVEHSDATRIIVADSSSELNDYITRYAPERVSGRHINAADEAAISALLQEADVAVEALPRTFAYQIGKLAVQQGVSLVTSSFYLDPGEQDRSKIQAIDELHQNAKARGLTILTEFGMDPGLDLVIGVRALSELDEVEEFHSYGAGLPDLKAADNPLKYKFSWSVIGVMRAYLRPAKIIADGHIVEIDPHDVFARANRHILDIEGLGAPLECYPNGDSTHYAKLFGLQDSVKAMGRYTGRWPGHCDFWEVMAKCGFLEWKPIQVGDAAVAPVDFTAALLGSQDQFRFTDDEQDITWLRVDVRGRAGRRKTRLVYQVIDRRDLKTGFTSMQRLTGFTMGLGARLILNRQLTTPGILSPLDVSYEPVVQSLKQHNITITRQELPWT